MPGGLRNLEADEIAACLWISLPPTLKRSLSKPAAYFLILEESETLEELPVHKW